MEKPINVLGKIASSLNRRDEIPNQELAKEILDTANKKAVEELVENLENKNKAIQNDCIKVLYEIGEVNPQLIAGYLDQFLALLSNKNNRLQWGGMTALNFISTIKPEEVYNVLPEILKAIDNGSVITRDHGVLILINLSTDSRYSESTMSLLIELLLKSPVNQVPMYAEKILPVVSTSAKKSFTAALTERLKDIEKPSAQKRIEKVLKKLMK